MKKIVSIVMLFVFCLTISAQEQISNNQKFLDRYSLLIKRMKPEYASNVDSLYAWKAENKKIKTLYSERYKYLFTDEELEEYSSLATQYKTRVAEYKLDKFGEKMDTLGNRVTKSLQKTGRKFSGFIKGLKEQSDKNRGKK